MGRFCVLTRHCAQQQRGPFKSAFKSRVSFASSRQYAYDKHKKEIWDMLYDLSEDSGFSIPFLMSDFDGARNVSDHDTFKNFLVWWAVTQKAREIEQD